MPGWLTQILYLVSAVLFIIGLKRLGSPATARQGNMISGVGMLIAILVTLARSRDRLVRGDRRRAWWWAPRWDCGRPTP